MPLSPPPPDELDEPEDDEPEEDERLAVLRAGALLDEEELEDELLLAALLEAERVAFGAGALESIQLWPKTPWRQSALASPLPAKAAATASNTNVKSVLMNVLPDTLEQREFRGNGRRLGCARRNRHRDRR